MSPFWLRSRLAGVDRKTVLTIATALCALYHSDAHTCPGSLHDLERSFWWCATELLKFADDSRDGRTCTKLAEWCNYYCGDLMADRIIANAAR